MVNVGYWEVISLESNIDFTQTSVATSSAKTS